MDFEITSAANPRMKRLARLARGDRDEGLFAVEGERLVRRALAAGLEPVEAYGDGSVTVEGLHPVLVAPGVLDRVSYRERSQGVIAIFERRRSDLEDIVPGEPALVLVGEGLEKPGNLGAILRAADGAGADLVLVAEGVDLFSPQVIRNSTGAVFALPVYPVAEEEAARFLEEQNLPLVAATPEGERLYWEGDYRGGVAFLLGAEDKGLPEAWKRRAQVRVRIPMRGRADSLNVAVTAALLLYEALRQRSGGAPL